MEITIRLIAGFILLFAIIPILVLSLSSGSGLFSTGYCRRISTMLYTIEPEPTTLHGHYAPELPPVLTIQPGDSVRFRTLDAGWFDLRTDLPLRMPLAETPAKSHSASTRTSTKRPGRRSKACSTYSNGAATGAKRR